MLFIFISGLKYKNYQDVIIDKIVHMYYGI